MNKDRKILKTAVVGLGRIGWQFHLPQIDSNESFELVCVADPLPERLKEASDKYGIKGYQEYTEMLKNEQIDLVVIASPTSFHREQAVQAFECGCDVFCEKPVVPDLQQIEEIIEAKTKLGRKFMAYQPHRGRAETVCLKHILSLGILGKVYMHKRTCSAYNRRSDWQALQKHGGGMLNNYGSHYIDQLLYISGSDISSVKCITKRIASLGDADDVVKAVFETENGLILDLDINMACAFELTPWRVFGSCGSAVYDDKSNVWRVKYFEPNQLENVSINTELAAADRSYGNGETIPWVLKEFAVSDFKPVSYYDKCYDYFALNAKPFVDISESKRLIEVIDTCRASCCKS